MTKLYRILICLLLGVSACAQVQDTDPVDFDSVEGAISTSPRKQRILVVILVNKIGKTAAQKAVLDDIKTYIQNWEDERYALYEDSGFTDSYGPAFKLCDVTTGATWAGNGSSMTWPSSFSSFPVANHWGHPIPHTPFYQSWTDSFNGYAYSGTRVLNNTLDPDTAWITVANSGNVATLDLDDTQSLPVNMIEPNTYNTLNNTGSRQLTVNSAMWGLFSAAKKQSLIDRAMFLGSNTGYSTSVSGSTRGGRRPSGTVASDWDRLKAVWTTPPSYTYAAGTPAAPFVPVPGY